MATLSYYAHLDANDNTINLCSLIYSGRDDFSVKKIIIIFKEFILFPTLAQQDILGLHCRVVNTKHFIRII